MSAVPSVDAASTTTIWWISRLSWLNLIIRLRIDPIVRETLRVGSTKVTVGSVVNSAVRESLSQAKDSHAYVRCSNHSETFILSINLPRVDGLWTHSELEPWNSQTVSASRILCRHVLSRVSSPVPAITAWEGGRPVALLDVCQRHTN